jgi:hypothetical protein
MSSPVRGDDGRLVPFWIPCWCVTPPALGKGFAQPKATGFNRALLTVPLLCSLCGRGFEPEGANQVDGGGSQVQVVQRRPQIDHISLLAAPRVEAAEDVIPSTKENRRVQQTTENDKVR